MTIHDFYSGILQVDCDTDHCHLSEADWYYLDHTCLKTATNGEVFRDDLGMFSSFRRLLLDYHPDRINRADRIVTLSEEIASELEDLLLERQMIAGRSRYLEPHVDEVLAE